MLIDFSQFHLLRPELLWLILPTLLVLYGVHHLAKRQSSWKNVISPHLLRFLMVSAQEQRSTVSFWLTTIITTLIIIAVSGPSFRQKAIPVFKTETARVILLDLSLSMDATDIKPSRIDRARHKIMDLLKQTNEGTIGLVIYAGDAFIISPLTSDANTIASMVPMLSTGMMPVLGSRPDIAISKAIELLENAKQPNGQIIWITDGLEQEYINAVTDLINHKKYLLSILAIGTEQGAPIPLADNNGFLKDGAGNIILPKLETGNLKEVTKNTNGQYVELSASTEDIEFIFTALNMNTNKDSSESDERINRWIDDGYWICWFILTLMFIKLFQRNNGQLMSVSSALLSFIVIATLTPKTAQASIWDDLWKTRDQQASQAYKKEDYEKASELFENNQWQAASNYKLGNFDSAIEQFSKSNDITSKYNKANSLAKAQKFEPAIELYDQVLAEQPSHQDAIFNKKLVEDLLKQQQQQEKQDQENKDKQDQEEKDQQESDSDSDSKQDSEEESEQENSEQQEQQQSEQESQEEKEQQEQQEAELSEDQREQAEKDQALEHWLEKIPDDPGGLLRRKMYREYQRRGRQQKEKQVW